MANSLFLLSHIWVFSYIHTQEYNLIGDEGGKQLSGSACAAPPPPYCIGILRCFMHAQGKYWKNGFLAYGRQSAREGVYSV
jgi:hypothetical protein